jgi:hypothetical protein
LSRERDRARVTTVVAVDPARAFALFTDEIDAWWRRGPRFRFLRSAEGVLRFEGQAGGLLLEAGAGETWEVGRVTVWEPAARLVFDWRLPSFAPHETTEVEVRFEPVAGGTRVTIEHRGFDALPREHPARHGLDGEALQAMIGLWWGDLVTVFRRHARTSARSSARD